MQKHKPIPKLAEKLRHFRWRWIKNGGDAWRYSRTRRKLDTKVSGVVDALKSDGIVNTRGISDPVLFAELHAECIKMLELAWDEDKQCPREGISDGKGDRSMMDARENKDFLRVLTPKSFSPDSIFLRYALQPQLIQIANAYLGMNAQLRAIQLWLNFATDDEAASTQLWHRDGDDFMNLKVFTYLTDVDECNGPFSYIPGTQPLGYRHIAPDQSKYGRTNDAQMQAVVDRQQWKICTGPAGSTVFSDTSGFHNGSKPMKGCNLILMVHFASRAAVSGNDIQLSGDPNPFLSVEQLSAFS